MICFFWQTPRGTVGSPDGLLFVLVGESQMAAQFRRHGHQLGPPFAVQYALACLQQSDSWALCAIQPSLSARTIASLVFARFSPVQSCNLLNFNGCSPTPESTITVRRASSSTSASFHDRLGMHDQHLIRQRVAGCRLGSLSALWRLEWDRCKPPRRPGWSIPGLFPCRRR